MFGSLGFSFLESLVWMASSCAGVGLHLVGADHGCILACEGWDVLGFEGHQHLVCTEVGMPLVGAEFWLFLVGADIRCAHIGEAWGVGLHDAAHLVFLSMNYF